MLQTVARLLRQEAKAGPSVAPDATDATSAGWLAELFGARRSHSGISVTAETYHRCPTAYASVAVIAQAVAQLPLHLFKRTADGGKERATDHPLYGLLAGIGKSILSAFGGGLPGFKTGGSFKVGGAGGLDSSIVAFRGTPGERVDISTKGQQRQTNGGGASIVHVSPSPYFDVQVQKVAGPMVSDGMRSAVQASSALVPSQMARADTYTVGRRRR